MHWMYRISNYDFFVDLFIVSLKLLYDNFIDCIVILCKIKKKLSTF